MPEFSILTVMLTAPLAGALLILGLPRERTGAIRWTALGFSLISLGLAPWALARFDLSRPGPQLVERWTWAPAIGASCVVGVDGISLWLVLLTTLIFPLALAASWTIEERVKEYMALMLALETAVLGVFLALDLLLFYIFWEFTLVPMTLLIGIWGGPRRVYAAVKFFLYTMAGSVFMLVAIVALWLLSRPLTGTGTFDLQWMAAQLSPLLSLEVQRWLFLAFGLAFAIKVPMWPFHSWLPDAHVEAPTAGSVILAALLLKMGAYGFVRWNFALFPDAARDFALPIAILAVVAILYGALASYAQEDFKRLVAFSSVSHMGFVMLGLSALNSLGIQAALLQMVNHGLSTGGLFLLVGMLYDRTHTRDFRELGGLWKTLPLYGGVLMVVGFSSMGLPGLNGFVGEFLILLGAFGSTALGTAARGLTALAAFGVALAAVYILTMILRVLHGPLPERWRGLPDLTRRELAIMAPILVLIVFIGLYPQPFFAAMQASVQQTVAALSEAALSMR
ncbi:MAG: NADH-quinone oxidoreductase subunit M [Thermoflexus sp.]|jgi:NADH-quinone oxidoreductase subunit M|nr:NADH-quinone oxidoreductase subunit M [Thermoflexus sp.]